MREWALVVAILVTAAVFDPLKRRIQGWVDRAFDRHRYDYRKALVEFGRSLSSETDLQRAARIHRRAAAAHPARRPRRRLSRRRSPEPAPGRLARPACRGGCAQIASSGSLDLGFLDFDQATDHSHIFLENAQQALHLPATSSADRRPARPELLPALPRAGRVAAATRTIAVIGLGRTIGGDFLSSEDVELLESLASYIGIALQNASLYARLEEKISEFERLKEFNENIVESINVGILALDLEDRIESWNAQMEAMYALSRAEAIGQALGSVFPAGIR